MRTLYVLATSPRPDSYINVIIHVLRSFHDVSSIKLVTISDSPESRQDAMTVMSNIERQLEALCNGQYIPNIARPKLIEPISDAGRLFYLNYSDTIKRMLGSASISLSYLDRDLRELIADRWCLFDVTALRKDLLTDVFSVLLAQEFRDIYYFELIKPALPQDSTKGRLDLIHDMRPREDYEFKNLMASDPVQRSLAHIRANLMQFRTAIAVLLAAAFVVFAVQAFFKETWITNTLVSVSIVGAIASMLFLFVNPRNVAKKAWHYRTRL